MSLMFDRMSRERFARLRESDDPGLRAGAEYLLHESVPVFEITNVAHLAARLEAVEKREGDEPGSFHIRPELFPNFGQPFRSYWMEFKIPDRHQFHLFNVQMDRVGVWCARIDDETRNAAAFGVFAGERGQPHLVARWVLAYDNEGNIQGDPATVAFDGDDPRRVLRFFHMFTGRNTAAGDAVIREDVHVVEMEARRIEAEEGVDARNAYLREQASDAEAIVERTHLRALDLIDDYLRLVTLPPVLLAHSLLSCKNVGTEEHAPARKLVKARQRRGRLCVKFKTLTIKPTGGARRAPAERISIGGGQTALHLVHGHFKTFTADAPLFGKHVGKYWWSPMVRGDESAGVVIKDYKMEVEA